MPLEPEGINSIPSFLPDEDACLDNHSSFDILLGKEKAIFNHSGNKRFRAIVNHNVYRYYNATTKSTKTKLVTKIYEDMRQAGFQFLKKSTSGWKRLKHSEARVKFSHALRDRVRELQRPSKRQEKSRKNLYSMITSMANILNKNQLLLQNAGLTPEDLSKQITGNELPEKMANKNLMKAHSEPASLADIIGSAPNTSTPQMSTVDNRSSEFYFDNVPIAVSATAAATATATPRNLVESTDISASDKCFEEFKLEENSSMGESLFGGLANEIADAQDENSGISKERQSRNDAPVKYVSFSNSHKCLRTSSLDERSYKDECNSTIMAQTTIGVMMNSCINNGMNCPTKEKHRGFSNSFDSSLDHDDSSLLLEHDEGFSMTSFSSDDGFLW